MIVYGNNFGSAFKASTFGGGGTRKRDGEGFCAVFALSVSFGDSSPKGRAVKTKFSFILLCFDKFKVTEQV